MVSCKECHPKDKADMGSIDFVVIGSTGEPLCQAVASTDTRKLSRHWVYSSGRPSL